MATHLAYRTAVTAGVFADSLAGDLTDVAQALRCGEVQAALEQFEASADRLQLFLTFLIVAAEQLADADPILGAQLGEYSGRLLCVLGRVDETLEQRDLASLTLTLEHGLCSALEDYASVDEYVQRAFAPAVAA